MPESPTGSLELDLTGAEAGPERDGYRPVTLETSRGDIACRHYAAAGARRGVIWVGGIGGDWDTPARELYPRLSRALLDRKIASLRIMFRHPTNLEESVLDVLAGIEYLQGDGLRTLGLVGHSLGGAVVIRAATESPETVRTVVTLSAQSYGAAPASRLGPRCSLLLIHGADDEVLPASSSRRIHELAREPKRLILHEGAGHGLDEAAGEVEREVREWLVEELEG